MGIFNNNERFINTHIREYIKYINSQIQTGLKFDSIIMKFNKNALQMLQKESILMMLLQNIKWKLGCQQNQIQQM